MTIDVSKFKPKTVYVTYIAATPEKVWQALVDPAFTREYFFGLAIEIEARAGGVFKLLVADGSTHVRGEVIAWSPPHRLCVTWRVVGRTDFSELPECLVSYDIVPMGESVQLTLSELHSWEIPPAILKGGESGWPKILSSLKSVLETGKPLSIAGDGMPAEFVEAIKKAVVERPWEK